MQDDDESGDNFEEDDEINSDIENEDEKMKLREESEAHVKSIDYCVLYAHLEEIVNKIRMITDQFS